MDALIITFIIVLIIVIILDILIINIKDEDYFSVKIFLIILADVLLLACGGVLSDIENYNKIPAIDVYRGNTTLEITYRDSVPVDSVVVFKDKRYE